MRLAVLIPAYNAGVELQRTLASLAPDPTPFDVVVVDDGSQPPLSVPPSAGDHHIVLRRYDVNRGIVRALNTGAKWLLERDYDFIARLDAGDMNEPDRFARQARYFETQPDLALVGSWTRHLDERLRPLFVTRYPATRDAILRRFHYMTAFSHTTCMIRVSALREAGVYDEYFKCGEDYELFWRVASRFPCANIPEVLVTRVESRGSLTHQNRLTMARVRLVIQWQHFAWKRLDCWLGVLRSLALLLVPARVATALKRAAGTVG